MKLAFTTMIVGAALIAGVAATAQTKARAARRNGARAISAAPATT